MYCSDVYRERRCCVNTIFPPEDGHVNARNMSRIILQHTYCYRIKELCIKLLIEISLTLLVCSFESVTKSAINKKERRLIK